VPGQSPGAIDGLGAAAAAEHSRIKFGGSRELLVPAATVRPLSSISGSARGSLSRTDGERHVRVGTTPRMTK